MNQYIYTWKCYNKIPCVAILNKIVPLKKKKQRTGSKTVLGMGGSQREGRR
jgi:hypothetical protein